MKYCKTREEFMKFTYNDILSIIKEMSPVERDELKRYVDKNGTNFNTIKYYIGRKYYSNFFNGTGFQDRLTDLIDC